MLQNYLLSKLSKNIILIGSRPQHASSVWCNICSKHIERASLPKHTDGHGTGNRPLPVTAVLQERYCPNWTTRTCSMAYKSECIFEIINVHELPVWLWYTTIRISFVAGDGRNTVIWVRQREQSLFATGTIKWDTTIHVNTLQNNRKEDSTCYGHRTVSEYFLIINFSGFLIRVLLEAYNSTLLRILLVFILQDFD